MRYVPTRLTSILLAALLTVGVMGCDSLVSGFDEDPNQPTEAQADLVLNSAQVASIMFHAGDYARLSGIFTGQMTGVERQFGGYNNYEYNAGDFDNMWITGYADIIGDLAIVKEEAREANNRLLLGIAKVVEAHTFGMKAALHGDIPFHEASQGNENLNPALDAQQDVYQSVIDSLDAAIADLEAGGISPGNLDVFYGGDAQSWIEAAYTLQARFLLHTADYAGAVAAAENGISSPAGDMVAPHGSSNYVDANQFYLFHQIERTGYMSAADSYAARLLDPESDLYRGNGATDETARLNYYFVGEEGSYDLNTTEEGFFAQDADYPLVTYVENELIRAEAILQSGGAEEDAIEALNNARTAHAEQFPEGTYEPYDAGDFADANALLEEILEEKYVSMIGHLEAFNDLRRTENFIGVPVRRGDTLPQRFLIAEVEVNTNENVTTADVGGRFDPTPVNEQINYTGVE